METQFGWHVIKLNEVRGTEAPTLENVREELTSELNTEAARVIISGAAENATVVIPDNEGIDPAVLMQRELLEQ